MKKAVSVVIIALSLLFVSAFSVNAQYSRIALVDLQKVFLESEKGKEARKALLYELDRIKKNLDAKQAELLKFKQAAEQQGPTALDESSEEGRQYRHKLKDYRNLSENYRKELEAKDRGLTEKMSKEIREIMKSRGAKDKYTLIVEKSRFDASTIFFMDPSIDIIDISEEVIREYNNFTGTQTTSAETGAIQLVPPPVPADTARADQTKEAKAKPTISQSKAQATKPHKALQKKKTPEGQVASQGINSLNKQSKEGPGDLGSSTVPRTSVREDPRDIDSYRPFLLSRKGLADFRPEKLD
jgi:Skp family chaperone for outer membrane proteins